MSRSGALYQLEYAVKLSQRIAKDEKDLDRRKEKLNKTMHDLDPQEAAEYARQTSA